MGTPVHHTPARASFLVFAFGLLGISMGAGTGYAAAARAQDPYAHLERFADVLTRIEVNYVEDLSGDQLVDAAIRGMLGELDEHSRWLSAEEARELAEDTEGSYEGIGVEIREAHDGFTIARVLPNGPAQFAGLAPGDVIVAVDGEPMRGVSIDQLSDKLKGPRGEEVVLSVLRDGWQAPQEIPTVRDRIHTPSVEGERFGDIVYVRLTQFQKGAAADVEAQAAELGVADARGVVLDLRDNPGGLLEEAVAVTDLFLDDGVIVSTRGRLDGHTEHHATVGGFAPGLPVVVLIDGMSASASEIVAAALQDTGRAVLVGEPTYGKGSVQTVYNYPDHEVAMPHRAPPGEALEAEIRALDVPDAKKRELLDLVHALPAGNADVSPIPWDTHGEERLRADPPLAKALEILAADANAEP